MKKIKVKVQHGANHTPMYVSTEPNRRGVHKAYTESQYKANPEQFEIVKESAKPSGRVMVEELGTIVTMESNRPLPPALAELNEVVRLLTPFRLNHTPQQIEAEAQQMVKLKESWQKRGLTEAAAGVAARQQIAMAPPASDIEFWSKFRF